ncbi:hypothetical protein [uncultured Bradyrhizobium sp.]|jgi:hypothetical protein|uniref:hypothetical protein n=1 Tax=uncultured Bradyrhizobium sp. TaxID=199684 RepID=UPI00262F94E2|nr:hypothetical protein [uncultured Bradyrhizobium sp.]
MRRPFGTVSSKPLAAQNVLRGGDMRMLLRENFWPDASRTTDIPAAALPAALALMALAGVPLAMVMEIKLADALPKGKPHTIVIEAGKRSELVRVSRAVALLIESWKRVRPQSASDRLFVAYGGAPISLPLFGKVTRKHFRHLGLKGSVQSHARRFFTECFFGSVRAKALGPIEASACAFALDRYFTKFDRRQRRTLPSQEDERIVRDYSNPFPDASKRFFDDPHALSDARSRGTALPDRYLACFRPKNNATAYGLPADHPMRVDLANIEWSPDWPMRDKQCQAVYRRYREDIRRHTGDSSVSIQEWAALFGIGVRRYRKMVNLDALGAAQLTSDEAKRLARIEAIVWPSQLAKRADLRRQILRKEAGFIFGLIAAGKLLNKRAADLLRISASDLGRMKREYAAGVFDHWIQAAPSRADTLMWKEFVYSKCSDRHEGQKNVDFILDLRCRYGVPLSDEVTRDALRRPTSRGAPGLPNAKSTGRFVLSLGEIELARLRDINAAKWPSRGRHHFRFKLLREHGAFVFKLVCQGRLRGIDVEPLFRLEQREVGELLALYREGDLELALHKLPRAEEKARMRLFLDDLAERGAKSSLADFCRDFRRRRRIYMPYQLARAMLRKIAKEEGRPISLAWKPEQASTMARLPLKAEERQRLRALANIDWERAPDIAALRRSVLKADGGFLIDLVADCKLPAANAAALINVDAKSFRGISSDWRAGFAARHIEPPPTGEERLRQIEIVRQEVTCAGRTDKLGHFILRVGKLGVLLPRHQISDLRTRLLSASA